MKRFVHGEARSQMSLLPECLDDYVSEDNPVRVVEAFVDALNLEKLGLKWSTKSGHRVKALQCHNEVNYDDKQKATQQLYR